MRKKETNPIKLPLTEVNSNAQKKIRSEAVEDSEVNHQFTLEKKQAFQWILCAWAFQKQCGEFTARPTVSGQAV